jgi:formate C-acetyltransferase
VAAHELVLPAALMMALTRGRRPPPAPGQSAGLDCGDPACFLTFERLMAAVRLQISHQVCLLVEAIAGRDEATRDLLPAPFVSALVDGCVEAGADVSAGGARHDFTSIVFRGLATFVDSLLAIRWLVHERAEMDLASYLAVVRDDFRGREDLRCRVVREAPKYGCGDPAADDLALEVLRFLHDEVSRYRNVRGGRYRVACFSYGNHVIDGFFLGATPDGRRAGDPVSNGASPSNLAAEAAGLLGPLRTVGRFPPGEVSGGVALNVRLHPSFLDGDNGVAALASVVRAHLRTAMHVAPNVVSTETLRDAQAYPERHRDLVVKVSGYSACFVDLGRSIQDDIIDRVELSGGG